MTELTGTSERAAGLGGYRSLADEINATDCHVLLEAAAKYYFQISQKHGDTREYFSSPEGEMIKVDETSVRYIPLYRDDDSGKMLVLVCSKTGESVVAVYLNGTWWSVDDILKSSDPSKEGLIQVQTFWERIALFVLNCLVCGFSEANGHEACFFPHASKELAKIYWCHGEAVGFYTYKNKGNLCNPGTSECYQLPVLDTVFVRKNWRRCGLGSKMLQDYSLVFSRESVLGISSPISPAMYTVCHKFLTCNPKDQDRFWEVEAPGYWSQRLNIWLKIQLGEAPATQKSSTDRVGEHDKRVSISAIKHPSVPDDKDPDESSDDSDGSVSLGNHRKRKSVKENVEEIPTKYMKAT
ncbi:protein FAM169B isoform X2 [Xenopus laevis]|uniref:Protein FAM169B isoform X2 n=2 Tax=Xenopus laevis TaxID=8355 RepID=A0A1L8H114_XENLA|nr:protein FAM169B isoform X2 [Xenopus laevis]OCT89780.1 hypothetical protein XELAEV_18018394mg [Xenopus laevis]